MSDRSMELQQAARDRHNAAALGQLAARNFSKARDDAARADAKAVFRDALERFEEATERWQRAIDKLE